MASGTFKDVLRSLSALVDAENYVDKLSDTARDFLGLLNPWTVEPVAGTLPTHAIGEKVSKEHIAQIRKLFKSVAPDHEIPEVYNTSLGIFKEQIKYAEEVVAAMEKHGIDPKSDIGKQFMKEMAQGVKIAPIAQGASPDEAKILLPKADELAKETKKLIDESKKEGGNLLDQFSKKCFSNPKTAIGVGAVVGLGGLWYLVDSFGLTGNDKSQETNQEQTTPEQPERSLGSRILQGTLSALALAVGAYAVKSGVKGLKA